MVDAAAALYGPLVEEGQRGLGRYSMAELELFIDFLQHDRARQEAHADRVRRLALRDRDRDAK